MRRNDPGCREHSHPKLKRPVSREQVRRELAELYRRAGFPGQLELEWDAPLGRTHDRNWRRYAQVAPLLDPPVFQLAPQTVYLPARHRRGLLAHEVGHVLDPDGSEDDADAAARAHTGVRIGYDSRWPGKGLQVSRNPEALRRDRGPLYRSVSPWEMQQILDAGYVYGAGAEDYRENCQTFFGEQLEDVLHHGESYWRYFVWHHPLFREGREVAERARALESALRPPVGGYAPWEVDPRRVRLYERASALSDRISGRLTRAAFAAAATAANSAKRLPADSYVLELHGVAGGVRYTGHDNIGGAGDSEVCFPPGTRIPVSKVARVYMVKAGQVVGVVEDLSGWHSVRLPRVSLRRLEQARDYALSRTRDLWKLERAAEGVAL